MKITFFFCKFMNNFSAFLFGTIIKKHFELILSTKPNIQICSRFRPLPRLYFIFATNDSSISMTLPGPPNTIFCD